MISYPSSQNRFQIVVSADPQHAPQFGGVVGGDQKRHFLRQHLFQRFGFFIPLGFRFVLIILLRLPQCIPAAS